MPTRDKEGYKKFIHDFVDLVLVVCPQCSGEAIVHSKFSFRKIQYQEIKVTCASCGFNKTQKEITSSILYSRSATKTKYILFGAPVDPFFKYPLRLQDSVNGNLFWAYNYEHLSFIRDLIEARLRERTNQSNFNASVASRLPRWLTSKSNRETVLNVIERLSKK
jgi:hypothetical protein